MQCLFFSCNERRDNKNSTSSTSTSTHIFSFHIIKCFDRCNKRRFFLFISFVFLFKFTTRCQIHDEIAVLRIEFAHFSHFAHDSKNFQIIDQMNEKAYQFQIVAKKHDVKEAIDHIFVHC